MDVVQSAVLHRKGKKWKSRWAVLRKNAAVADPFVAVTLNLYKDANHAVSKQHKRILPLWKYAGCITVDKLDKVENVLVIFTENSTIVFGFDGSSILRQWYEAFHSQFGKETTFPISIPAKQKLRAGEAKLLLYSDFFSIIHNKTFRCVGRFNIQELYGFATIEGDFLFEVHRSRATKGHGYPKGYSNTFRLKTRYSEDIVQVLEYIKGEYESGLKGPLQTQFDTGSGSILDMERERRNTIDSDQSFFQRALLRVSNRFRKHRRNRAATVSEQSNSRRQRIEQLNQAVLSKENGSTHEVERVSNDTSNAGGDFQNEASVKRGNEKVRSNSYGDFGSDPGRRPRVKAQNRNEVGTESISSVQSSGIRTATPRRNLSSSAIPTGRTKTSAGSVSGVSIGSRGVSTCSDVFPEDDVSEPRDQRNAKLHGPPVAPPRSPISLGIFEFPDANGTLAEEEWDYLNDKGLDMLTRRESPSPKIAPEIVYRKKAEETSLLDEIDREIKRRTREEESIGIAPSTPLSQTSFDGPSQYDRYDNDEKEAYVMLRTTDLGPTVSTHPDIIDGNTGQGQSTEMGPVGTAENHLENSSAVLSIVKKPDGIPISDMNSDPGVHSPNKIDHSEPSSNYQNVSEVVVGAKDNVASKGRRNSSRRSSSKHLSDPLLTERLANIQQKWQGQSDNVASSLRELPHEEMTYVNVEGQNNNENESSYVNVSSEGPATRKPRKNKPAPLNINFDKYDDDDKIYHDVGPLMGGERSGSSEAVTYRNIGVGSYENLAGRAVRNRAYVNVPSPSQNKLLNYVLVGGSKGGLPSSSSRTNRSDSLNSLSSDKSQYSMIDEKATSLLQRTREQHWQRREEDGQAKLKKTKKSQGE